jgi:glutamate N-acetyltransferase/amino-acid N-acetyltransferase
MNVSGAADLSQARKAARAVVSSALVKAAVFGADPNWGRIMAAVGRSGAEVKESKFDLNVGKIALVKSGKPLPFDKSAVTALLKEKEVLFSANLNLGSGSATAWGCDLSPEYVTINSQYMT